MALLFTKDVQGQLCDPGETAVFSCATDMAHQGLTASWLKDNKPISDNMADRAKITAKENVFTLSIEKVAGADSGQYTCRVTNANNETCTCSAQLEVHQLSAAEKAEREKSQAPVYMVKLRDTDAILGSTASFMIHV